MQNLEQLRAAAALKTAPNTTKAAVNKLPAMILSNGLLAACAFANEPKDKPDAPKRPEMKAALDGAAQHLGRPEIGIAQLTNCRHVSDLIAKLSTANSVTCQRATSEALAFLGYVKRFATKEGSDNSADQ
jgi:CRISPR-associated protein Cmr5